MRCRPVENRTANVGRSQMLGNGAHALVHTLGVFINSHTLGGKAHKLIQGIYLLQMFYKTAQSTDLKKQTRNMTFRQKAR